MKTKQTCVLLPNRNKEMTAYNVYPVENGKFDIYWEENGKEGNMLLCIQETVYLVSNVPLYPRTFSVVKSLNLIKSFNKP